jgi:Fe-S cluster biogenesis protein NfuA
MFIQTETTPNPATLKFLPGCDVMTRGTANFTGPEEAAKSPLALRLFGIDGVTGVFLGSDFVTVTKMPTRDWEVMKPFVLSAIMDHFTSGDSVVADEASAAGGEAEDGEIVAQIKESVVADEASAAGGEAEDGEIVAQIKELLETRVRPAVAQDGGDIVFRGFEDGIVYLHMQGACSGCPSSTATLKHGIENMLKYYVPEVQEVRPVEDW